MNLGPNPAQPVERRVNIRPLSNGGAAVVEYLKPVRNLSAVWCSLMGGTWLLRRGLRIKIARCYIQRQFFSLLEGQQRCEVLIGYVDTSYPMT